MNRILSEALHQQVVEALTEAMTYTSSPSWSPSMTRDCEKALAILQAAPTAQEPSTAQPQPAAQAADKVQMPDKARAGIEVLHQVVESLLTTSRYVDEEGEATQALADLSACIADPPFRLAVAQGDGEMRDAPASGVKEMDRG